MLKNSRYTYRNIHPQKNINSSVEQKVTNFSNLLVSSGYDRFKRVLQPKFSNKNLKLQNPILQKKSKYKWQNQNNVTHLPPSSSQNQLNKSDLVAWTKLNKELFNVYKIPLNTIIETFVNNHYGSSLPFYSSISKGWFSRPPCDTTCLKSKSLDLQSCCFISERYLPVNTLNINKFMDKIAYNKTKSVKIIDDNSFVKLSKHKLIRKQDHDVNKSLGPVDSSIVFCTQRKLIRESKGALNKNDSGISKIVKVPESRVSSSKLNSPAKPLLVMNKRKRSTSSPILLLTKSKLVRKQNINSNLLSSKNKKLTRLAAINDPLNSCSAKLPEKLIRVNSNKVIRSSLLQKNKEPKQLKSHFTNSVLHHMIQHRRRPYPGSGYILLSRNKLIKKVKFKNKTWKKQTDATNIKEVPRKSNLFSKTFVSLGSNKLIRKSLFTKTNKINYHRNVGQAVSPLSKKLLIRVLQSPSRRIQRFTNHLWRRNLKYLSTLSSNAGSRKFTNKCKDNRKTLRKMKNNFICPIFRRKGECLKYKNNICSFLHDRKYIALCQPYIKNNCENESCLLSHELIPQKMPVCMHFLQNNCEFKECPYLHVKCDINATICAQFLRGYCENGDKCSNWHVYACPDYKNSSKCAKGDKCRLPHRSLEYFDGKFDTTDDDDDNVINWRYFEKNKINEKDLTSATIIPEKHGLGVLPDYIPF